MSCILHPTFLLHSILTITALCCFTAAHAKPWKQVFLRDMYGPKIGYQSPKSNRACPKPPRRAVEIKLLSWDFTLRQEVTKCDSKKAKWREVIVNTREGRKRVRFRRLTDGAEIPYPPVSFPGGDEHWVRLR